MNLTSSEDLVTHFSFKNNKERQQFFAERLQLRFISLVEEELEQRNLSKKFLADKLGVSKSYISQIFAADALLNFKTLGKIEDTLGIQFDVSINTKMDDKLESSIDGSGNMVDFFDFRGSNFESYPIIVPEESREEVQAG